MILVGVLTEASRWDAHPPERLERASPNLRIRQARLVLLERLLEVIRDAQERIQPRHGFLKDETELRPAQLAEFGGRELDEVAAVEIDLAVGSGPVGQQPEDAAAERRLAATRLADQSHDLALPDLD
jgi:hypothetical protein